MGYLSLLKLNPRTIGFGFFLAFFSGLGQTHFVSLFSPVLMEKFQLSATQYGSLYSLVTLISGFAIVFIGPWIDRYDARKFGVSVGLGLLLSMALIYPLSHIGLIAVGLFGLRLFGQGLCSSLSSITVARYFNEERGKALSLTQMGYPFYEGLITPLGALVLGWMSFQNFIFIFSLPVLFIFIPLMWNLTQKIPDFNKVLEAEGTTHRNDGDEAKSWTRKEVFSSPKVWMLIPQVLMPPFALTGLFFHQAILADLKGWSLQLMASGLFFFAVGRVVNTFLTGPVVDKHSAKKLFPFYQIPLTLGFVILAYGNSQWLPAVCFTLFGLSVGSGGPIKSAIWAELFGVKHLGAIKSLFATFMVLSTAASPALFGWILDQYQSSQGLLFWLFVSSALSATLSYFALKNLAPKS